MSLKFRLALIFTAMVVLTVVLTTALSWQELVHEPGDPETGPEDRNESMGWRLMEIVLRSTGPAAVVAVGAWWLTRRMLLPIADLTRAAEELQKGCYGGQIPYSGNTDELSRLVNTFNRMSRQVESSFQRIREFTLHASHELKTPLTVLRATFEQRLPLTAIGSAERDELASMLDEVHRLTSIVDALSLLTRADSGQQHFEHREVDLTALVTGAREDTEALADGRKLTVSMGRCDAVRVAGDKFRLRQLLLILADNAVKYNHPGGYVTLELERGHGEAVVRFTNSGRGLTEEEQSRVFDRFYRGPESRSMEIEGCGLGLSIAKWIAEAHHGTLSLHSRASTITTELSLPVLLD
ncbi:MAG: cztS [Verrucomicrobiales bacterium]|nr:cztS [Verrucomicrobiales bacterium]